MKVATVLDNSCPLFIILRQRGIISVCIRKIMASLSSPYFFSFNYFITTLTRAPITPKLVTLRFSNGLALLEVLRNGYKNKGMWAI